jgi:Zn-dependent protease
LIFAYLDLLQASLWLFLVFFGSVVAALLVGITFHEFSHALAAYLLGDPMARNMGRLSLNPKVHLDPMGTLLLFVGGFGWGKPVPVNSHRLRNGPKAGMATVAAAGPISNLVVAAAAGLPIHAGIVPWRTPFIVPYSVAAWDGADYLGLFLSSVIIFNVVLAVFNLIPLAPLDGFNVAAGLLPRDLSDMVISLEPYGLPVLFILLMLPLLTHGSVSILYHVMSPAINDLTRVFTGVNGSVFG